MVPSANPGWQTLDGYLSSAVLLDRHGTILFANAAWRQFMRNNGGDDANCGVGVNYLKVCEQAAGADRGTTQAVMGGIRSVLSGSRDWFEVNYPCHSPEEQRWFRMRVEPYADEWGARLLVLHSPVASLEDQELSRLRWAELMAALEMWRARMAELNTPPGAGERERLSLLEESLRLALEATRRRLQE